MVLLITLLLLMFLLVFSIAFILFLVVEILAMFNVDAPFVPVIKGVEQDVAENFVLDQKSVLYDLGCGDGRILITLAEKHPETKMIGVELAVFPYILAKIKTKKYKNIKIIRNNFWNITLHDATHVFCYISSKGTPKIYEKFKKECRPGTVLMSCDFNLPDVTPTQEITLPDRHLHRGKKLYIYTI